MSRTLRNASTALGTALVLAVTAGCGSSAPTADKTASPRASPSASPSTTTGSSAPPATPRAPSYAVVKGSKAGAQRLLDRAEVRQGPSSQGTFDLVFSFGPTPVEVTGQYDFAGRAGRTDYQMEVPGATLRTLLIGPDAWVKVEGPDGGTQGCWLHQHRPGATAAASAMYFVISPHARGLLRGGTGSQVVMELDPTETLETLFPKLGSQIIPKPGSVVPAVATLRKGHFRDITFSTAAVIQTLTASDLDALIKANGLAADAKSALTGSGVAVRYVDAPGSVAIGPPPSASVVEMSQVSQSTSCQ